MTNIIKDVTDDWARGWCFIPETALLEAGTTAEKLTAPSHAESGVRAVDMVNARARHLYAEAIAYILAIPREEEALRWAPRERAGRAGDDDYLGRQNPGRPQILEDEDYLGRQNPGRDGLARSQEYHFEVSGRAKSERKVIFFHFEKRFSFTFSGPAIFFHSTFLSLLSERKVIFFHTHAMLSAAAQ